MACSGNKSNQVGVTNRGVTVPFGWQRNVKDGGVCYISPSGVQLSSTDDVKAYLIADDTCKCGIECPIHVEEVFIFDGDVSASSDPRREYTSVSTSCKHALQRHEKEGEQKMSIRNQGVQLMSTAAPHDAAIHQGVGGLPIQMRPSLQRTDVLMQNSIEAQQHQIQLKIRQASVRQAQVLSSSTECGRTNPASSVRSLPGATSQPSGSSATAIGNQEHVDLQRRSASFSLGMSKPTSSVLHQMLEQQLPQQQQASMYNHAGHLKSKPLPSESQRSKSLEEQQWYYSMMRSSAPVSPVSANIIPGVSAFYQPGLPLVNVYGQPSANLVSFQPSFPIAEYPMIFSRGGGNMPTMMRHVTPVSLISQFPGAQLGIPYYGSTIPMVQRTGAIPFGMVPHPVVPQRALIRLPPPVEPVSTSCNTTTSLPNSIVTPGSHIVLQAPKTVKDLLAENRSHGMSDASSPDEASPPPANSLGTEHEAVRNEVAETLCSLSSGGELLFESSGTDIPTHSKGSSQRVIHNQKACTTVDYDITRVVTHSNQNKELIGGCGFNVNYIKLVKPLVEAEIMVNSNQNLPSISDSRVLSINTQSQSFSHGTVKQLTPVNKVHDLVSARSVIQECQTEVDAEAAELQDTKDSSIASASFPQALRTFLSPSKEATSSEPTTCAHMWKTSLNVAAVVQRASALSDVEQAEDGVLGSALPSKTLRPDHSMEDRNSAKETKTAAVETLLQLGSQENLYSVRESKPAEKEQNGATSCFPHVPSADLVRDHVKMSVKQLRNITVPDSPCITSSEVLSNHNSSSSATQCIQTGDQVPFRDGICGSVVLPQICGEDTKLSVDSETKHQDAHERNSSTTVNDIPTQRIDSTCDKSLVGSILNQSIIESETKDLKGDSVPNMVTSKVNTAAGELDQNNVSGCEINSRKMRTLEADSDNLMCNENKVCENNSSMVGIGKGRVQTLDGKYSLPVNHVSEYSDENGTGERQEIPCPLEIVEIGKELNMFGKSERLETKCEEVESVIQCQDDREKEMEDVGKDEAEVSHSFMPVRLEGDNMPASDSSIPPQARNNRNQTSSDKENMEYSNSFQVSRVMSQPELPGRTSQSEEEDNRTSWYKDRKVAGCEPAGEKVSLLPNDSVLIDSTLININTEQEQQSHQEVESSHLLSSLDVASSKRQSSINSYPENQTPLYKCSSAAQVDSMSMVESDGMLLSDVPLTRRRGAERDALINSTSLSFLNCSVKDSELARNGLIKDQDQPFTNVGRMTRHRRLDPVLAVETSRDTISSADLPSRALRRHFETGDLVWGQTRGHTSWPGKLVSDLDVKGQRRKEHGKVWVMWFGDHSYAQVEPDELKTLSEGLEAHHNARTRVSRYMNMARRLTTNLEAAIQEAMLELDKQTGQVESTKRTISTRTRQVKRPKNR